MPRSWKDIDGGVWEVDDRGQEQTFGRDIGGGWIVWSAELRLRRGHCCCTVRARMAWGDRGEREGAPPPLWGGPILPVLFPKTYVAATMTGRGVPGWSFKSDQLIGSLCAPPHKNKIVILEEGNRSYPRWPKCDMFVSHKALNGWHLATAVFRRERRGSGINSRRRHRWG